MAVSIGEITNEVAVAGPGSAVAAGAAPAGRETQPSWSALDAARAVADGLAARRARVEVEPRHTTPQTGGYHG